MEDLSIQERQRMHDHGRTLARRGYSERDIELRLERLSQTCGREAARIVAEGFACGKKSMSVIGEPRRKSYNDGMYAYNSGRSNSPPPYVMGTGYKKGYSKYQQDAWCAGWLAAKASHKAKVRLVDFNPNWAPKVTQTGRASMQYINELLARTPTPTFHIDCKAKFDSPRLVHIDELSHTNLLVGQWDNVDTNQPKEPEMKTNFTYLFATLLPDVVTVNVIFAGTPYRTYSYKALGEQNIKAGDKVVVDSPNSGLTVVEVQSVGTVDDLDPEAYNGYKWIIGTIATGDYTVVREKEAIFVEKVAEARRKAVRQAKLAALAEEVGGMDVLRSLLGEMAPAPQAPEAAKPQDVQDPDSYAKE